jgi:hypothetical protein
MKKIKLLTMAMACCGTLLFMVSCGGENTETNTTPDESSIQTEHDYKHGDEPLQGTGADGDTTMTGDTATTTIQ